MITTERLVLIPGNTAILEAELRGAEDLGHALQVQIPASWPPPLYDRPAIEWTLERIAEDAEHEQWGFHYFVLQPEEERDEFLAIGAGGYKGPPWEGQVEIGYSVLPEFQRRGYATEAALGLVQRAFGSAGVEIVVAEALPDFEPSIGVLMKLGFQRVGEGSEPGVIRYELRQGP